jgi:hypothetical protein
LASAGVRVLSSLLPLMLVIEVPPASTPLDPPLPELWPPVPPPLEPPLPSVPPLELQPAAAIVEASTSALASPMSPVRMCM